MVVLDANAVLRFLLRDNEEMAFFVRDRMNEETCLVPIEVLAEVVYVLVKVYKIDRDQVWKSVDGFLINENVDVPHRKVVEKAVRVYGETKFDFVDCLMIGYAAVEGHKIVTFDKKLKNYSNTSAVWC